MKTGGELRCSGKVSTSVTIVGVFRSINVTSSYHYLNSELCPDPRRSVLNINEVFSSPERTVVCYNVRVNSEGTIPHQTIL